MAQTEIFQRLTRDPEAPEPLLQLNADAIAQTLAAAHPSAATDSIALEAARQTDAALDAALDKGRSVLVETVLSTDKHLGRVDRAKACHYWFGLVYILLRDPELNIARVAQRVAQGGHPVPEARIRARWERSLANLPKFAAKADGLTVWDNSFADQPALLLIEAIPDAFHVSATCEALMKRTDSAALRAALSGVIEAL